MNPNQFLIIIIAVAIVFLIIGVYIGYLLANKDEANNWAQIKKMDEHDLFMKRHGLTNKKN